MHWDKRAQELYLNQVDYNTAMPSKLDRETVLQSIKGYKVVNEIIDAERRSRLKTMTDEEARKVFASLYETWKRTGKHAGGDWEALARRKLEQRIQLQQAFELLARRKGLI